MDWLLVLSLLAGFALLVAGADLLVDGASRIASYLGVSSFVIGLTIVAYGTSAPELAVTIVTALVIMLKGEVNRWFGLTLFAYFILFLLTRYGWLNDIQGVMLAMSWCAPLVIIGAVFVVSRLFSPARTENLQND